MRTVKTMVVGVAFALLLSIGACGGADDLGRAGDEIVEGGREVLRRAEPAPGPAKPPPARPAPPRDSENPLSIVPAHQVVDVQLAEALASEIDPLIRAQYQQLDQRAVRVVDTAVPLQPENLPDRYNVQEVTKELIVDAACQVVLDQIAPDQQPEEPGKGSAWTDPAMAAAEKLRARGKLSLAADAMAWVDYGQSVLEDGAQVADAVLADPDPYIRLGTRPPVARAIVVYARMCYAPPRSIGARTG